VPEVLRPLYESPKILAQKMTIAVYMPFHYIVDNNLLAICSDTESVI
jgi:hypothetical protein